LTADCNDAIPAIRAATAGAISLAFVDPTNWQVRFESIAELVRDRRVDLLFTFHHGAMRRVRDADALDAFFDNSQWRRLVKLPKREVAGALVELYNRQLERLGYLDTHLHRVPVRNRKNVVMYDLVVFTRDPRGVDFWRKTLSAPDEVGQRGFWP
jgi:three-Cys-motif partner protein